MTTFIKRSFDQVSNPSKRIQSSPPFEAVLYESQPLSTMLLLKLPLKDLCSYARTSKDSYASAQPVFLINARALGYKGTDLAGAKKRIENLCLRILIFQEQDQKVAFGHGLQAFYYQTHPRIDERSPPPLVPQFPSELDLKKHQLIYPHSTQLLFENCKKFKLEEICTWFLLNPGYYISQETLWIDFFEVESSWSQVPAEGHSRASSMLLYNALCMAYFFQRPQLVQILLSKGAPLNRLPDQSPLRHPFAPNAELPTPIGSAIIHEDQEAIDFLLSKGIKVTTNDLIFCIDTQKRTVNITLLTLLLPHCRKPLDLFYQRHVHDLWVNAVSARSQEALELFMQHGCVIKPKQALSSMCNFMLRRIQFKEGCNDPFAQYYLNLMLEQKADINGYNGINLTLLHEAVRRKSEEWTRWLLENGAEVDKGHRITPLYDLCSNRYPEPEDLELVRLLLSFGANPHGTPGPYQLAQQFNVLEFMTIFEEHFKRIEHHASN